ncbi:PTS sugar transporter subunit IIB [Enemella sp. A6]|uniref:PTS sugar transporter subunit IIB n=1 Tax=Enemella sp. A6 TaxID=3440152 RepID=UPI003EBFE091
MKRILVVCGTGVATSTVVVSKVREHLAAKGIDADVSQGKVMDLIGGNVDADLIVATTEVPESVTVPSVAALPLLTGVGEEAVFEEIDKHLS